MFSWPQKMFFFQSFLHFSVRTKKLYIISFNDLKKQLSAFTVFSNGQRGNILHFAVNPKEMK